MWLFSRKKVNQQEPPEITALVNDRGLRDLTDNSAVLRFWLPEVGRKALDQTIKNSGIVAAKYLREFFVVHLYGEHELLKMQATKEGLYYVPPLKPLEHTSQRSSEEVLYSRAPSVECIPGLGKNIFPFKIYLPQRVKDDLQGLADNTGIPLSQFIREILISHFFGQTFWPAKLKTWSEDQELIGEEWANRERKTVSISYNGPPPREIDGDHVVQWISEF
jgi:hypothetical protein